MFISCAPLFGGAFTLAPPLPATAHHPSYVFISSRHHAPSLRFIHTRHGRFTRQGRVGHHHYHLFYLHRNSDIRWNLGWDHCYLVDLSIERGYFLFFRFMDMYLGDLGGGAFCVFALVHHSIHFKWFTSGYPVSILIVCRCGGWCSAKVCPGCVRDANDFRAWGQFRTC